MSYVTKVELSFSQAYEGVLRTLIEIQEAEKKKRDEEWQKKKEERKKRAKERRRKAREEREEKRRREDVQVELIMLKDDSEDGTINSNVQTKPFNSCNEPDLDLDLDCNKVLAQAVNEYIDSKSRFSLRTILDSMTSDLMSSKNDLF